MSDLISRQAAIDAYILHTMDYLVGEKPRRAFTEVLRELPPAQPEVLAHGEGELSAQPEIIRCKDCVYYDPPHVENNGVRSEYSEMPEDAFDVLGVGLVSAEYGINIGGRCCRDYNVSYSEDKRVFIPETNYCGRAERRTDE